MAVFNLVGSIQVNQFRSNSGIFFGENVQYGWDSHSKQNVVLGEFPGNVNLVINPANLLYDPDPIDTPINDQDVETSCSPSILKVI